MSVRVSLMSFGVAMSVLLLLLDTAHGQDKTYEGNSISYDTGTNQTAGSWSKASMTWYGPGDSVNSYNPITTGYANCLANHKDKVPDGLIAKYSKLYAGVNDKGPAFGGGSCRDNPASKDYPICDAQANCGRCYELRCTSACLRSSSCSSTCNQATVTVLMVDACPADAPFQAQLEKQYGFNGCRAAAQSNSDHFDVSPEALETIRSGDSGELGIEFREVPC